MNDQTPNTPATPPSEPFQPKSPMLDINAMSKAIADAQHRLHVARAKADHLWEILGTIDARIHTAKEVLQSLPLIPPELLSSSEAKAIEMQAQAELAGRVKSYAEFQPLFVQATEAVRAELESSKAIGRKTEAEVREATQALKDTLPAAPAGDPAGEVPPN